VWSVAHDSAVQGKTAGQHSEAAKRVGRLGDVEVAGGLSAATPFDGERPVAVACDQGMSLQLGGG
jgi:hypothetical protein